jgi:hypothetical protein
MYKTYLLPLVIIISLFATSCSDSDTEAEEPELPIDSVGVTINSSGGSLESTDKNISVVIPAGAVNSSVSIEIEELANDAANGIGKIYSLTEQQFLKPVTLTLKYTDDELSTKKTYPALLRLVTRKSAVSSWEVVDDFVIDQTTKTVKAEVDHFSDWTLVSTDGTLDFSMDGVSYKNLSLSVTMGTKLGRPAKFRASSTDRYFTATVDSTIMGTSYATLSAYLGKIAALTEQAPTDTSNVLLVEPNPNSCYRRSDGSTRFRFTNYSTTTNALVTGTFTLVGTLPTDNSTCQARKTITGTFAYKVK